MERVIRAPRVLEGRVVPPGDKSISHRAAILNSIALGEARISNFSPGADFFSTLSCLRALGVGIEGQGREIRVRGVGKWGLKEAGDVLDAGNSATTMRLLAGLLAAQPFLSLITGDESLRSRPMDRLIKPLRLMGAQIWGRKGDSLAPLAIKGEPLHGIEYHLPVPSAQVKSAILLAGLFAEGATTVVESASTRDHTERLLRVMGAAIDKSESKITLSPGSGLHSQDVAVPGDISAAAFWLVAGAIHPQASVEMVGVGLNPTRSGIVEVLQAMGAKLEVKNLREEGGEPVADLCIESSALKGIEIGGELISRLIDEVPVIAVAAAQAQGTTVIRDAGELRVKESDRISITVQELSKLGARIEELPDGMIVHGVRRLKGALCSSHHDHRLAMALGVAALVAEGETAIQNAEAADISYPDFWSDLERSGVL